MVARTPGHRHTLLPGQQPRWVLWYSSRKFAALDLSELGKTKSCNFSVAPSALPVAAAFLGSPGQTPMARTYRATIQRGCSPFHLASQWLLWTSGPHVRDDLFIFWPAFS